MKWMKTKIHRGCFVLLMLFLCCRAGAQTAVWLAPDGCDTSGDGSRSKPYASVGKALSGRLGDGTDTLFVNVREGDYFLDRLIDIRQPNSRPVVIRASEGTPRFIGGRRVRGWEPTDDGLFRAYVPEAFNGLDFMQFYVNGRRATLARTPNDGYFKPLGVSEVGAARDGNVLHSQAILRFECAPEAIKAIRSASISKDEGPKIRFHHKWDNTYMRVNLLDRDSCAFYSFGSGQKPWNPIDSTSLFFFYDYIQALDEPGEWYFDRKEGYLYYKPFPYENLEESVCVVPVLRHWLRIKGNGREHVSNIRFENISFEYSSFLIPGGVRGPEQAAAGTPAAIELDFADNISFVNCRMSHTGAYALWIREACSGNVVNHCLFSDLGAGGIKVGLRECPAEGEYFTNGNIIDNNIITGGGYELPCGIGVGILQSSDNRVTHNEINNLGYSGISVGWVWGYSYSPARRNVVEFNHIHHIGRGDMSDMGAVYTLGFSDGTRVNNNLIHDVISYDYGGWGLYTDEGSTHVEMYNNLVYRCKSGGFHQHYGKENRIENNILAYSSVQQIQLTRSENHKSFSFDRNIILQEEGATVKGPWDKALIDYGKNIFWSESEEQPFCDFEGGFEGFRKKVAPGSVRIDPHFKDPHGGDFRFSTLKSARIIGFKPFDYSQAGVYGSAEWKRRARETE